MAYFNKNNLQGSTIEDLMLELVYRFHQVEKEHKESFEDVEQQASYVYKVNWNTASEGLFVFSGSLPITNYLGDDGKPKFDAIEFLASVGSSYGSGQLAN